MLMLRAKPPAGWVDLIRDHLDQVLVDHAHLERKAATSALNLEKYPELWSRVDELNAIAMEELQHFQMVLDILRRRGIPFTGTRQSPWISGLYAEIRQGRREQVIDHLICAALIEGRSCEKFQILSTALEERDPELATFYGNLVESEGNHYASYLLMARDIDELETNRRLDFYLDVDAKLIRSLPASTALH